LKRDRPRDGCGLGGPRDSGTSLDVAGCSTANGAAAIVRTYTGADCQRWRIETTP
jgi:hypothetical protein